MRDQQLLDRLAGLRRRIRMLLVVDGVGLVIAAGVISVLAAALIDYLIWLPAAARLIVAAGFCGSLLLAIWVRVVRPVIARIELGEVAGVADSRFAELEDRLASAVSFVRAPHGVSTAMVERVVDQAGEAAARLPLDSLLRPRRPLLMVGAAVAVCGAMAWVAVAAPWFVSTGLKRYVSPLGSVQWPRRVLIESLTGDAKRPAGGWFEARARLRRGRNDSLRVYVHTESPMGRRERHPMTHDAKSGRYFYAFKDLRQDFSYWFEAGDDSSADRGERFDVVVVPRPAVLAAELTLTDPPYVSGSQPRTIELLDASVSAVVGSRARLMLLTNKPLFPDRQERSSVTLTLPGDTEGSGSSSRPGSAGTGSDAKLRMTPADDSGRRFTAVFEVMRTGEITVHLVDENGFDNRGGTRYALTAGDDEPPHVVIVEPQAVTEVTPAAAVNVAVSADDDFGVSELAVETSVDRTKTDRPTVFDLTDRMRPRRAGGRAVVSAQWPWDLAAMKLKPGDVVTYRARARDAYERAGRRHPPSFSAEMRLKVISPEQLSQRVRGELMLLKNALRQMLSEQETVHDRTATHEAEMDKSGGLTDVERESLARVAGRQIRLASRAQYLSRRFDKIVKRLDANRSDDPEARKRSEQASERLASLSSGAMAGASEQLQQAGRTRAPSDQAEGLRSAAKYQQAAVQQLRSLLAAMDRWGDFQDVVRNVQQMLDRQERQTESTRRLGRKTLGRRVEDLSDDLRAELKQHVRRQRRLAEDLGRLKENMARLAESIRKRDAASATALDDARRQAEADQLDRKMNASADAVARNRMAQAQTTQRQIEDGLRKMLGRLEGRQMQQLAVLSKRLQGAVEKVQTLIEDQKKLLEETKRLAESKDDAAERERLARRQRGLARAAGAIAEDVAKLERASRPARGIQRSSGRMDRAADRLEQGQAGKAAGEQDQAVRRLAEALEHLKKLRAQAEAEMAAKTLAAIAEEMKALRDAQNGVNERLDKLAGTRASGRSLSRLELRRADKLSGRQRDLAEKLERIRDRVKTAAVYDWVMRQIGEDMTRLADRFDRRLLDSKSSKLAGVILDRLNHLLAGLEQEPPDDASSDDRFAEGGGGGQGRGTREKPVPTVAELAVLKAMQSELNRSTRQADLTRQMSDQVDEEQLETVRQLGRRQEQIRKLADGIVRRVRR